jgi:hypothetical protein
MQYGGRFQIMQPLKPYKRSRKYGKLTHTAQELLSHFLEGIKGIALTALQSCDAIYAAAPLLPGVAPQVEYWKKIVQAIEWCESWTKRKLPFVEGMALALANGELPSTVRSIEWVQLMGICSTADEILKASVNQEQSESTSAHTSERQDQPSEDIKLLSRG